ncbi:MAG: phospholipase, partial [Chitinophagaceae bacterium]
MHKRNIIQKGEKLFANSRVLIMIHGRGAKAEDILGLAAHLPVKNFSLLAPQATNDTWYPYSFMATPGDNEP